MTRVEAKMYLNPGDIVFTNEKVKIWTVLGSCVSIILHDRRTGYTGMTHAQLPEYSPCKGQCTESCPKPCGAQVDGENIYRYVNCSLHYLLMKFKKKRVSYDDLEARLYGGSNILRLKGNRIGNQNVMVARGLIQLFKLKLLHEDVGGDTGRTINYFTDTAEAVVTMQNRLDAKKTAEFANFVKHTTVR